MFIPNLVKKEPFWLICFNVFVGGWMKLDELDFSPAVAWEPGGENWRVGKQVARKNWAGLVPTKNWSQWYCGATIEQKKTSFYFTFRGPKDLGGTWSEMIKRKSSVRDWKTTLWIVDGLWSAVWVPASHSAASTTTTRAHVGLLALVDLQAFGAGWVYGVQGYQGGSDPSGSHTDQKKGDMRGDMRAGSGPAAN